MHTDTVIHRALHWLGYTGVANSEPSPRYTNSLCANCGQRLIQVDFNQSYCALMCDNWRCRLFRQVQGTIRKDTPKSPRKDNATRLANPTYVSYLAQRQINYRALRDAGVPCRDASRMTSNKQTKLGLEIMGTPSP